MRNGEELDVSVPEILQARLDSKEYFLSQRTAYATIQMNIATDLLKKSTLKVSLEEGQRFIAQESIRSLLSPQATLALNIGGLSPRKRYTFKIELLDTAGKVRATKDIYFYKTEGPFDI